MDNDLNNIKNEAAKIRLSPQEKSAMKALLRKYYEGQARPIPSAYVSYFTLRSFSGAGQFINARVLAPLLVLIVVFAGAGTAAAAQGSLPGDILYPVKVSVNEAVEVALATTPVAKAQVEGDLAERRVEEAEALSQNGKLTPDTSAALAANFETHVQNAQDLSNDVAAQDPEAGASLKADLTSTLAAHSAILASLGQDSSTTEPENAGSSDALATRVLARADGSTPAPAAAKGVTLAVAPQAKVQSFVALSATTTDEDASSTPDATTTPADPAQEKVAAKLEAKAADALADAHADFDDAKGGLDATTSAQVSDKLAGLDDLMQDGSAALDAHGYADAKADFIQTLSASIKLSTLLVAQQKLDKNVITPVLQQNLINTSDSGDNPPTLPEGEGVGL